LWGFSPILQSSDESGCSASARGMDFPASQQISQAPLQWGQSALLPPRKTLYRAVAPAPQPAPPAPPAVPAEPSLDPPTVYELLQADFAAGDMFGSEMKVQWLPQSPYAHPALTSSLQSARTSTSYRSGAASTLGPADNAEGSSAAAVNTAESVHSAPQQW
jgi:hypothetical protein